MALSPKKGAPNLYEVLKDALKKQERERAARKAAESSEPAAAESPVSAETPIEAAPEPEPAPIAVDASVFSEPPQPEEPTVEPPAIAAPVAEAPIPAPEPEPAFAAAPSKPLGERSATFSFNTLAFAGLIGLASLFAAYSAGLHRGRHEATAPAEEGVAAEEETSAVEPGWRLRVMEWPARGPSEERGARANAQSLMRGLTARGFIESAFSMGLVEKPAGKVLRLFYGNFADPDAPEAAQWRGLLESYRDRSFDLSRSVALERSGP